MNLLQALRNHAEKNFILAALLLLILYFSLATENFFSVVTLTTVLNQLPALTTVTVGMTLVLIVAGIDLSVGSVVGLSATVIGVALVSLGSVAASFSAGATASAFVGAASRDPAVLDGLDENWVRFGDADGLPRHAAWTDDHLDLLQPLGIR